MFQVVLDEVNKKKSKRSGLNNRSKDKAHEGSDSESLYICTRLMNKKRKKNKKTRPSITTGR